MLTKLLDGLCGEHGRNEWIDKLENWLAGRERQMLIYRHTFDWLYEKIKSRGVELDWHKNLDEAIKHQVYHEISYTPFVWSSSENKVIKNKYSGGTPLMSNLQVEEVLNYINDKMANGVSPVYSFERG